jgi:ParB/RepB/Spo0J family partition protein
MLVVLKTIFSSIFRKSLFLIPLEFLNHIDNGKIHAREFEIVYILRTFSLQGMKVPVKLIDHRQFRQDTIQDTRDLELSFLTNGQLSPILIREHPTRASRYEIIFGNRRLAAARRLGWETIEAQLIEADDQNSLIMAFSENIDRKDFSDYEKALMLSKLHHMTGKNSKEIAELIGRSASFVSQHMAMIYLFPDFIASEEERVKALKSLTESHSRILSKIADPSERWDTAKLVINANLSVRELEKYCRKPGHAFTKRNESVRDIVKKTVNALNSKSVDGFFQSISDKDFSLFSRFPPFDKMDAGRAKDHEYNWLKMIQKVRVEIEDLDVKFYGNVAVAIMKTSHNLTMPTGKIETESRATIILTKKENTWSIVHEHWSTANPSDMTEIRKFVKKPSILTR